MSPTRRPTSVGPPISDLGAGIWAVERILAALYERQRTGKAALLLETAIGFSSWSKMHPTSACGPRTAI